MLKRKIILLVLSCILAVAMVLPSCGAATPDEEEGVTVTGKVTETEKEAAKEEEEAEAEAEVKEAVEEPLYGGTLRIITTTNQDPLSWDIAECQAIQNQISSPFLENLLVGNIDRGVRGTGEFSFVAHEWIPDSAYTGSLAESWEILQDPLRLVFHLRQGVMWQERSGVMAAREFVADDVVYALKRYDETPRSSPARLEWVTSFTAADKYTVVLELNRFHANWGYLIAWGWTTKIYPREVVEAGANNWKNQSGTGPFRIVDYVEGSSLVYDRNLNYWGKGIINGEEYQLPLVDTMVYHLVPDESTRNAALTTGKVDILEGVSWKFGVPIRESHPELLTWDLLGSGTYLVAMRIDTPPFDDLRVRRAMAMAIDRQAVLDAVYVGAGVLHAHPLYPGYPETIYTPLEKLPPEVQELYSYNPEEAKRLLAEAGYPEGFKTSIVMQNDPIPVDIISMYADFWADIGVELEMDAMEWAAQYSIMANQSHEQMLAFGRGNTNPFNVLRAIFLCEQWWNPAMLCDQKYEDMYWTAAETTDTEKREAMVKEMAVYLLTQVPYISGPGTYYMRFAWPWVKNYYGESDFAYFNAVPGYARIWIDEDLKKEMGH